MCIVVLEHILLLARMVVRHAISDIPPDVEQGKRERRELIDQYVKKKKDDSNDIGKTYEIICRSKDFIKNFLKQTIYDNNGNKIKRTFPIKYNLLF